MVAIKENFWNFRAGDNQNRSHIPPTPYWIAIIRIVQLAFALLILILTAVAASKFGSSWSSLGITWFTFSLTLLHIGWLALSILIWPIAYNYWAQLGVEIASVIFWLASWASVAADASALDTVPSANGVPRGTASYKTGADAMKAAAGIGALQWILFIITLVFFVISLVHYRKANKPAAGTTGTEAAVHEAKAGHELSQVTQPLQFHQQQPTGEYQQPQQPYPPSYPQQPGAPPANGIYQGQQGPYAPQ